METGTSTDNNGYEVIKNGSWFIQFRNGYNPWMARYVYGLMFLLVNLLAWAVRDYGRGALAEMRSMVSRVLASQFLNNVFPINDDCVYSICRIEEL